MSLRREELARELDELDPRRLPSLDEMSPPGAKCRVPGCQCPGFLGHYGGPCLNCPHTDRDHW